MGARALGVLLFQDILVAPILIFVGFTASQSDAGLAAVLGQALLNGLIALLIIFVIGRFLLRHLFRLAAHAGGRDFLMAITLLTVVGASVITANAGLSLALGAFLAGLLLGETEFKHQTEIDLEPFKGLLLGLFFLTVGLAIDIGVVVDNWQMVFGGLVALLIVKALIAFVAVRIFSGNRPSRWKPRRCSPRRGSLPLSSSAQGWPPAPCDRLRPPPFSRPLSPCPC